MAITIIENFTQNKFYPSSNPINCTVDSNNSGKCNFRYICDIYINGTKIISDKLFPDPTTGYGFFQISRLIEDYIEAETPKTTYNEIWNLAALASAPTSNLQVYCRFGEEYDNSITCDGDILQYTNLATSNTFYVFQTAIDYEDFPSFNYNNYLFATSSSTGKLFLTNLRDEIEVTYNDSYSLDFISLQTINASYSCVVKTYDFSNTLTNTYTYTKSLTQTRRYRLAVGPFDLNYYNQLPIISPLVNYYTVQVNWAGTQISELITFKVKAPNAFRTRIAFVGLKGGLEHFTFYHRDRKTFQLERKNYEKVLQSNYSNQWRYEVGDRGTTTYATNAKETHQVSSYCSKQVSEWLYELWLSPDVWTYQEPKLYTFRPFQDGIYVKYWIDGDHGLSVGDDVLSFSDNVDFVDTFTVVSVNGNIVDFGLLYSVYGATMLGTCGQVQKLTTWSKLPITPTDNSIEVKQRLGRPIEYTINYQMAYSKTTLR
jgi:hypothetical protein